MPAGSARNTDGVLDKSRCSRVFWDFDMAIVRSRLGLSFAHCACFAKAQQYGSLAVGWLFTNSIAV